jgi:hypothetical protein
MVEQWGGGHGCRRGSHPYPKPSPQDAKQPHGIHQSTPPNAPCLPHQRNNKQKITSDSTNPPILWHVHTQDPPTACTTSPNPAFGTQTPYLSLTHRNAMQPSRRETSLHAELDTARYVGCRVCQAPSAKRRRQIWGVGVWNREQEDWRTGEYLGVWLGVVGRRDGWMFGRVSAGRNSEHTRTHNRPGGNGARRAAVWYGCRLSDCVCLRVCVVLLSCCLP